MVAEIAEMPRSGDPRDSLLALDHAVSEDKINGGPKAIGSHENCILNRLLNCVEELIIALVHLDLAFRRVGRRKRERKGGGERSVHMIVPIFPPTPSPVYKAQINTLRREKEAAITCCFCLPHVSPLAVE